MSNITTKLAKDMGDTGDQICPHVIYIYHVPGVKVGSTYNLEDRLKAQGYDLSEVEVLYRIIPNTSSYNHIWRQEQITARQLGLKDEHNGNRLAVNRARVSKTLTRCRPYVLTQVDAPCTVFVLNAREFEAEHNLSKGVLSRAANPNARQRYVVVDGGKFSVRYATNR